MRIFVVMRKGGNESDFGNKRTNDGQVSHGMYALVTEHRSPREAFSREEIEGRSVHSFSSWD